MVEIEQAAIPAHVAIIMDGNGRWAQRRSLPRVMGHRKGVAALKTAVRFAKRRGIKTLTVYAFSTENWARPAEEVQFLMNLMHETFFKEIDELEKEGVKVVLVGDRGSLSAGVQQLWERAEARTAGNSALTLNVAFNYGSRTEIVTAARRLAAKAAAGELDPEAIDDALFAQHLYTSHCPDPDLLIRTGGELRLSNFLLWQSAYTEIYVTETLWPDFGEEEFEAALKAYAGRERRFGRVPQKGSEG
ncbi:MAG: UDP pyrophosphate synthase [Peptococcaceae bacterium 1109]|nr:MAG: UDP pyrophosphate synthase [Peptococcaceae bacterium 1109]